MRVGSRVKTSLSSTVQSTRRKRSRIGTRAERRGVRCVVNKQAATIRATSQRRERIAPFRLVERGKPMQLDDDEAGESWAEILARRGPEGRAVVDELQRAEQAVLATRAKVMAAMKEHRDYAQDFAALTAAMDEVSRMRQEVYRLARQ